MNRMEFNLERFVKDLVKRGILLDKISYFNNELKIKFYRYFEVYLVDDYCFYFNIYWYLYDNNEILDFIDDLINEVYVFYY